MKKYIGIRLASLIPTLFGVSVVIFLLLRLTPGDPAMVMLGSDVTAEALEAVRRDLGHDQPLPVQYVLWLGRAVRGDLGESLFLRRPVLQAIGDRFGATALLTGAALALSTALGIAAGVLAATRRGGWVDVGSMMLSLAGVSMPVFWLGIVLIVVFSLQFRWLPPSGMYPPSGERELTDLARHLMLPAVTLALPSMAIVARLTRSTMLEVLHNDYVRTARAKGLAERLVITRHALRNALIPVVTVIGLQVGTLLGGAVLVEAVFSWPGLGSLMLAAIANRDFPLVQGVTLFVAVIFGFVNLAVDLSYAVLDPRVRYG